MRQTDFLIVGGGIVGLTLARELAQRRAGKITVVEKEASVGQHASGRNSGVVHAGIYYPAGTNKAKFCVEGHRRLLEYVQEHKLPALRCGKVIVATKPENVQTLATLLTRAKDNGVEVKKISLEELRELEPCAQSHEWAIWSPNTAVIDSRAVLDTLTSELKTLGVDVVYGERIEMIDPKVRTAKATRETWQYGTLLNAAGVYADRIAHIFDVGRKYRILPFKGLYWQATDDFASRVQRLIYPAPDINMPFLGVHITRTVDGKVLFGPTAIPAFGRENYSLFGALDPLETPKISWQLMRMMIRNPGGFRRYVREELGRYRSKNFYLEAKTLAPELRREDIGAFYKVGIRAQLMDLERGALEMDFVIEKGKHSLHVLNAISPAFTSAFAFAPYLADQISRL
jgi:(S)-2-hydroxyglutarate dehydrogenase